MWRQKAELLTSWDNTRIMATTRYQLCFFFISSYRMLLLLHKCNTMFTSDQIFREVQSTIVTCDEIWNRPPDQLKMGWTCTCEGTGCEGTFFMSSILTLTNSHKNLFSLCNTSNCTIQNWKGTCDQEYKNTRLPQLPLKQKDFCFEQWRIKHMSSCKLIKFLLHLQIHFSHSNREKGNEESSSFSSRNPIS